jgi:hypothetical protein
LPGYKLVQTFPGFLESLLAKVLIALLFFCGFALAPLLPMLPRALLDRRMRFLAATLAFMAAGMLIQIFLFPHYIAPFTAAFYAVGLQAMRHLRLWRAGGNAVGLALVRLSVALCVLMAGVRLFAAPLHLPIPEWPPSTWIASWSGPGHFGTRRASVEAALEKLPGKQLAIVRYAPQHNVFDEWVYNSADLDNSKVIWAREMDPSGDEALLHYYRNRKTWLVQPDTNPATVMPYALKTQPPGQANERTP